MVFFLSLRKTHRFQRPIETTTRERFDSIVGRYARVSQTAEKHIAKIQSVNRAWRKARWKFSKVRRESIFPIASLDNVGAGQNNEALLSLNADYLINHHKI